jgi:hypothetical protein
LVTQESVATFSLPGSRFSFRGQFDDAPGGLERGILITVRQAEIG